MAAGPSSKWIHRDYLGDGVGTRWFNSARRVPSGNRGVNLPKKVGMGWWVLGQSVSAGESVSSLPLAAHAPIALAMVAGFLLWLIGGRLIRPAFAAAGFVGGALGGFLLVPLLGFEKILELPSPYAGLIFGGLLGLIGAIVVFRLAVAISASAALAVAGLLGGMVFLQLSPAGGSGGGSTGTSSSERGTDRRGATGELADELRELVKDSPLEDAEGRVRDVGRESMERLDEGTRGLVRSVAGRSRAFVDSLAAQGRALWASTGHRERTILLGSTLLGAAGGLLLGLAAPRRSASIVSAMAGSAVWLASAVWLIHAIEMPGREMLDRSPIAWVTVWLAVALVGMVLQGRSRGDEE